MARKARLLLTAASLTVLPLLGIGVFYRTTPEAFRRVPVTRSEQEAADRPVPPTIGANRKRESTPGTKAITLNQALEQRPPALSDRQTTASADPERQARYAMRAARAQRLNLRLTQRIKTLEATLASSSGAEATAISAELTQLHANLVRRQELERAAFPAPVTRPAL